MSLAKLPVEIGQEIFLYCLPEDRDVLPRAGSAPLVFLGVSQTWRALALGTPRLWATMPIEIWSGQSYPPLPDVERWLERSGDVPFAFTLRQMTGWGDDDRLTSKLIRKFLRHIHRWQDVTLKLASATSVRAMNGHQNVVPSLLRSMNIHFSVSFDVLHAEDVDEFSKTLLLFTQAPHFSSLVIHGANVFHSIDIPNEIQWGGITDIKLSEVDSVYTCIDLFTICKNLISCSLGVRASDSDQESPTSCHAIHPIILPGLSSLTVSLDEVGMREIFGRLQVPQLRELSISSCSVVWPQDSFMSLLNRSCCALAKASFLNTRMLPENFVETLSHSALASLTCLAVQEEGWLPEDWVSVMSLKSIELMNEVDQHNGLPMFMPHLGSLVFTGRCVEDDCGKAIVDMVLTRWKHGSLTQFSWMNQYITAELDEVDFKRLADAEGDGFELCIGRIGHMWWEV